MRSENLLKKRLIPAFAMILGWTIGASAVTPAPLTTLRAIHALDNPQAAHNLPVDFEATVVYFRGYENLLFVQDDNCAIFVRPPVNLNLQPGDRIRIEGVTRQSFRPLVIGNAVTLVRHGSLPVPVPATYDELIRAERDSILVRLAAKVRAADLMISAPGAPPSTRLQLITDGGHFEVYLDNENLNAVTSLLDAEVEVDGVAAGKFDDKMQQTGVVLYVSSLRNIHVLHPAGDSPWSLPVTPMDRILSVYHVRELTSRVRVHGSITYYQPGSAIVLQDGPKSLWISTHSREPLRVGDLADVTGFPEAHERVLTLSDAEIKDTGIYAPIAPLTASWRDLAFWSSNSPIGHQQDLVSTEGEVVTEVREASQDEYVLSVNGQLFTAIYHHPPAGSPLPPMMKVPLGAKARVTGICMVVDANSITPGAEVPFNILLRSFDDIAVVAPPSLLNIRNLILLISVLLVVVFTGGARAWSLERKVRRQTAALAARTEAEAALGRQMAQLEQRRSHILEDINGSRPLAEILEQIVGLVSFRLGGALSWCEVTDGARLGAVPERLASLRVTHAPIPARAGAPLGTIFVAFDAHTRPADLEFEALSLGARLAALAIETRRLYSDLLHRSEFDLLTDLHNRFSLDKLLESRIEHARENAGIFGLIYIDLDGFKQINDIYGHQVGDLYLQEVSLRMTRQLRSHDLLARLGGDEFAALVSVVPSRSGVEEIAQRLERCFEEPFAVDGYALQGAASVGIALYPEDGTTRDSLLSAADAAMYVAKHTKHTRPPNTNTEPDRQPAPPKEEFTPKQRS
ncbi:MAG: GGDEF domain-containing protein [Terracidiphilus sp.]